MQSVNGFAIITNNFILFFLVICYLYQRRYVFPRFVVDCFFSVSRITKKLWMERVGLEIIINQVDLGDETHL